MKLMSKMNNEADKSPAKSNFYEKPLKTNFYESKYHNGELNFVYKQKWALQENTSLWK